MRSQIDRKIVRQWRIVWDMLSRPQGVTTRELVELTGVGERTVRRDLKTLHDAGLPIEETVSSHGRKHWRIREWNVDLAFNFEEAGGLFLAARLLESQLRGTLFSDAARQAFHKLRSKLTTGVTRFLDKWADQVHVGNLGASDYGPRRDLIDAVSRAIEDRKVAFLLYQSPRATEPVAYESYPLALVMHRGSAYVEAWLPKSNKVQTFKLDRLHGCDVTEMQFRTPEGIDIARDLRNAFGIFRGDGPPRKVVLRFTGAEVTQYVLEKTWPTEKQKVRQRDGSVLLELEVTALEEVQSWAQSFGPAVEVLEPPDLRERLIQGARAVLGLYEQTVSRTEPRRRRVSPK